MVNVKQERVKLEEGYKGKERERDTKQEAGDGRCEDPGTVADVLQIEGSSRVVVEEKRVVGVYVPVDNSAFEAYAITARDMRR